jgi:hypothetical protein
VTTLLTLALLPAWLASVTGWAWWIVWHELVRGMA